MNNKDGLTHHTDTFHNSTGKQTQTDGSGICLSEGVYSLRKPKENGKIKATQRVGCKRTLCVCFQNKEKAGGKQIDCAHSKLHKVGLSLKKI